MTAAEVFTSFVELVKDDGALHVANVETFNKLLQLSEDQAAVNVAVRVKILNFVAQSIKYYDAKVAKAVAQLSVKIIASDSFEDPAVIAAIKLFPALALIPTENRPDYFAREGADVIIQVILDETAFSAPVRAVAKDALQALILSGFKSVLTKLIHLISDDREADEAEYVQKERTFAWETLLQLVKNKAAYGTQWTEEVQQHFLQCLAVVLHTVPKDEFAKLIEVASSLSVVRDQQFLPLLDSYLGGAKLDGPRGLEGLSMISAVIPRGAITTLAEKVIKDQLVKKIDFKGETTPLQLAQIQVLVFAAKTASNEAALALMGEVLGAVMLSGIFEDASTCQSLALIEGLLLSMFYLSPKCGPMLLAALSDPTLGEKLTKTTEELTQLNKQVLFAVKKKVDASTATSDDAATLTVLANLEFLIAPLAKRQVPSLAAFVPSWEKTNKLPEIKRKATRADADEPLCKKHGSETARKPNNGGNNNNSNNNKSNNGQKQQQNNSAKKYSNGPRRR
ncbi:Hypothetical protein, putative [Bodo saltans]|uniref:Uncharacterized protein n=1 Tax=Bodo saltans TaxID=75058 RepID=A0A0S4JSH7_BODSA|nr:Hypothetical protein, putative [Bodo saltans]|eukprot:CUG92942.1 Hypothetical protein, putative [Bodo saltans]